MPNRITVTKNGKVWFCYGNMREIPCQIFKDFRDDKESCPANHLCCRPDKGNYYKNEKKEMKFCDIMVETDT